MTNENQILWTPSAARANSSQMAAYQNWLQENRDLSFDSYNDLWDWSVTELEVFWQSICDFFQLEFSSPATTVLSERRMPGAEWFPGARLNWAENILSAGLLHEEKQALVVHSETFDRSEMSWKQLRDSVASLADNLREMGVGQGDRVAAVLPNTESAIIACLATTSLGAIWSLCAPDMGHVAILDRFQQIKPKVLIYQNNYRHAGKKISRAVEMSAVVTGLPSLEHHIAVKTDDQPLPESAVDWDGLLQRPAELQFAQVAFDNPLWVVYSSGTTGNPKPIVHGHGGILLEGLKQTLHLDVSDQSRFCWLTSSGWVMWNSQLVALFAVVMIMVL